jgi:hypothetical protein
MTRNGRHRDPLRPFCFALVVAFSCFLARGASADDTHLAPATGAAESQTVGSPHKRCVTVILERHGEPMWLERDDDANDCPAGTRTVGHYTMAVGDARYGIDIDAPVRLEYEPPFPVLRIIGVVVGGFGVVGVGVDLYLAAELCGKQPCSRETVTGLVAGGSISFAVALAGTVLAIAAGPAKPSVAKHLLQSRIVPEVIPTVGGAIGGVRVRF